MEKIKSYHVEGFILSRKSDTEIEQTLKTNFLESWIHIREWVEKCPTCDNQKIFDLCPICEHDKDVILCCGHYYKLSTLRSPICPICGKDLTKE